MTTVNQSKSNLKEKGEHNMNKPLWIVVTGLDGSGKTNLVSNLAEYYRKKGLRVKTAHLPFDTHLQQDVLPKLGTHRYADRLLFALDNHVFASQVEEWTDENECDLIISQRGFFDSFVHGSVQGFSYSFIADLNQIEDLPECDVMIHLCANADVAYNRIKNDPDADKFEYPKYIRRQEMMTRAGYNDLINGDPDLLAFAECKNLFIDTTRISIEETFEKSKRFLESLKLF